MTKIVDNITVELFVKEGKQFAYICNENGTGAEYDIKSLNDIGKAVVDYISLYC